MDIPIEFTGSTGRFPPPSGGSGLRFVAGGWEDLPARPGAGAELEPGGYLFLYIGAEPLAYRPVYAATGAELEAECRQAAATMAPWTRALERLTAAARTMHRYYMLQSVVREQLRLGGDDGLTYVPVPGGNLRDPGWLARIAEFAADGDLLPPPDRPEAAPEGVVLAIEISNRLAREWQELKDAAVRALPSAECPLPASFGEQWLAMRPPHTPCLDQVAALVVGRWTKAPTDVARDHTVRWVIGQTGMTKTQLHRQTGIARSTLDRILAAEERSQAA